MQPALILTELGRVLSPADVPVVLAALKQDDLVWGTLQDPAFVRTIIANESSEIAAWSPASLALKPLGDRINLSAISADHMPGVDGSVRKQAIEILEATIKNGSPAEILTDAGLIALALRERRRKMQSWCGIYDALVAIKPKTGQSLYEVWKTPLACLFGMVPDRADLLKAILPQGAMRPAMAWAAHMLLSNPLDEDTRSELFFGAMAHLSLEQQVEWLRYLKQSGQSSLTAALAERVLAANGNVLDVGKDDFCPDRAELVEFGQKILRNQVSATLHQFAGHPLQAGLLLEKTRELLQHWLVGTTIQLLSITDSGAKNEVDEHCAWMLNQFPLSDELVGESMFAFAEKQQAYSLSDPNYAARLVLAKMDQAKQLVLSGSSRQAQEVAYIAVHEWLQQVEREPEMLSGQFVFEFNPWGLLNQLVDLGLYSDAIAVGEKFLSVRPEDHKLMVWLSDLCHRIGEDTKAVDFIYQVILTGPDQPENYRKLAGYYEDRQKWDEATDVRQRILEIVPLPAINDHLALARCSFGGQAFQDVIATCDKILAVDPDQGFAYTYKGMACLAAGDLEKGLANLNKATLLIPENPLPWIQLAEAYKGSGDAQRAIETLRAAIITAPESAELHFALGCACLESGQTSEALPFLRQSAKLDPESDRVGLALAKTLLQLGHENEALEVVEKTRANWPAQAELAYIHSQILLNKKDIDRGLSILEIALQADNPQSEWFILYAKTLVGEIERFSAVPNSEVDTAALLKANKMIQKAVSIAPDSFEARLLLAEILSLRGEQEAAYAAYLQIVELPEAALPEWNWRVQAGLGRTALALNQTETALASLQNAVAANPDSLSLQRSLAQAYRQANLFESAQSSARAARALAPDDIDNLVWFADFMGSIDQAEEAVGAYELARQLAPERVDLAILMADGLQRKGEIDGCRQLLQEATGMEKVNGNDLRQIAHAFLRIGDNNQALACLERAVASQPGGVDDFQYELANLYAKTADYDKALETIQKAIRDNPRKVEYFLFQSEVQDQSNRPQAALASLEHVLRLIRASSSASDEDQGTARGVAISLSEMKRPAYDLVDIHLRFARLLQKVENLGSALYHAEKALEEQPENIETRYLAVELAMKLLQFEHAEQIAALPERGEGDAELQTSVASEDAFWLAGIYSLRAVMELDRGDLDKATHWIQAGQALAPQHPRLQACEVHWLADNCEYQTAGEKFEGLWQAWAPFISQKAPAAIDQMQPALPPQAMLASLGAAAMDLCLWNQGLELFEKYVSLNPTEPLGLLNYARGLVKAAEWQVTAKELLLQKHAAPEGALSESAYGKFAQLIADAKKYSNSVEINRWKARGEAVFHPSTAAVRALSGEQASSDDVSAMVQAMSRLGNVQGAVQIGDPYPNQPHINLVLGLSTLKEKPDYALAKVRAALAGEPKFPLAHAAFALANEKVGDIENAYESMKSALYYWPEEGFWQEWAGKLAEHLNDWASAGEHYELARRLLPESTGIAISLGKAYLQLGKHQEAVQIFSKVSKAAQNNAEIWQYLAEAQFGAGNTQEAQVSAETSSRLNPNCSASRVLCGEISFALGNEAKALEMVRSALKIDPANIRARLLTNKILRTRGKDKEALNELNNALEEIPDAVDLHIERAKLVYKLSGAVEAIKVLAPLTQSFSNNEQLLALQAEACAEVGDTIQAEAAALQSIRLNPSQPGLHQILGKIYQQTGQLDKSVHHLSEAIRLKDDNAEIYLELGDVYTARREYSEALATFQQAMKAAPEDYRPFYQSALILRDGKDYQGAESMLRRAAQLAPNDVNIRRQLGAIVALNLVQSCQEANTCQ